MMADFEAVVEISTGGSTFKISGSEKFVEKMVDLLPSAFPAEAAAPAPPAKDVTQKPKSGFKGESLDDFVARVKMTNDLAGVRKVAAFVVHLTEGADQPSCSLADIEACFDKTGLRTPENLGTVINNAAKERSGAYVRSVSRGQYAATTNGKNLVKEMAQG